MKASNQFKRKIKFIIKKVGSAIAFTPLICAVIFALHYAAGLEFTLAFTSATIEMLFVVRMATS